MSGMGILFLTLLIGAALGRMGLLSWADPQTRNRPWGGGGNEGSFRIIKGFRLILRGD